MTNGRYGAGGTKNSNDAELAEIRTELRSQGKSIASMATKMDDVTKAVTEMSVQMKHLVTKESCAQGRSDLAKDMKHRMDSSRDITGHNISVKELIADYVGRNKGKATPVPEKIKASLESTQETSKHLEKNKERGAAFWIGIASGLLAIVVAFYSASTFVEKTLERNERTEQVLIQIQQALEKQAADSKKAIVPEDVSRKAQR